MASLSSSADKAFEVFLSFHGKDTRKGFTGHLYEALKIRGVHTFMDEERLEFGESIQKNLWKAIERSSVCVPILSPNYAASRWCLMELVKMVQCGNKTKILPVFYRVDPSAVRKQKGPFEAAFLKYRELNDINVEEWTAALREVGTLKGFNLDIDAQGHEAKFVNMIVKEVLEKLLIVPLHLPGPYLVGIDSRVEEMMRLLGDGEDDVRTVGVVGMPGIGKSTLAAAVYNRIYREFDSSVFLSQVAEQSKVRPSGLTLLQEKLVHALLRDNSVKINSIREGKTIIQQRLSQNKVLLVIDDADSSEQLNTLAEQKAWFGKGSRIIITTRDAHILNVHGLTRGEIYRPDVLSSDDSFQLFSYYAFKSHQPPKEYMQLSEKIVSTTGGLPLALELIGAFLFDKRDPVKWEELFQYLKLEAPFIQEKLRVVYDDLSEEEKTIFLDIACFFTGCDKHYAIAFWEGCHLNKVKLSVEVLLQRCLVKIGASNELIMHDQLRDMGRRVASEMQPGDAGEQTRLWRADKVLGVLNNCRGSSSIDGIDVSREETIGLLSTESFKRMKDLRMLRVNHASIEGKFKHMPTRLRWLEWHGCPLQFLPNEFNLEGIAVLDLADSEKLTRVWRDTFKNATKSKPSVTLGVIWKAKSMSKKMFENLRILDLSNCSQLEATPDFSTSPNLERLVLFRCAALIQVHKSIGTLKKLLVLNMNWCSSLKTLPESIWGLSRLEELDLGFCISLTEFPDYIDNEEGVSETLGKLQSLNLKGCRSLARLPDAIGNMEDLTELDLSESAIEEIPDSIQVLDRLCKVNLRYCVNLRRLPNYINLVALNHLNLSSSGIEELPDSFGVLGNLYTLNLSYCIKLRRLPKTIGLLRKLTALDLSWSSIEELPPSIGYLYALFTFTLSCCKNLTKIPVSIGYMEALTHLDLSWTSVHELPDAIGYLSELQTLNMSYCKNLKSLPGSIGRLKALRHIDLGWSGIEVLPESIGFLVGLEALNLTNCTKLKIWPTSIKQSVVTI